MGYHYIPRFYLRGFATEDAIWVYDKRAGRRFATQVKSVANETSMYSDDLETYLANQIEDPANSAIAKVRTRQELTREERIALATYIIVLWKRVPIARSRALARLPGLAAEVQTDLHAELDQHALDNPDLLSEIEKFRGDVDAAVATQYENPDPEIWYRSIQSWSSPRLVDALLSMNWIFLHSNSSQFLTSDNPVFFFKHEGIGKPTSELTWPLSSGLALWATRQPRPSMSYLSASSGAIKEINRRTVHNSSRFVYGQKDEHWVLPFVLKKQWTLSRLA